MAAKSNNGHSARPKAAAKRKASRPSRIELRLYVAGQTPRSLAALTNLKSLCEERVQGRYKLEVIDLLKHPRLASGDQILAVPTLVRRLPQPLRKIIGDLSDRQKLLVGLDLQELDRSF